MVTPRLNQDDPLGIGAPYAPPANDANPTHGGVHQGARSYGYRSRLVLVRVLSGSLIASALLQGSNALCFAAGASGVLNPEQYRSAQAFSRFASIGFATALFAGLMLFVWFLVGSNQNADAFARSTSAVFPQGEAGVFGFSPGSMVWAFVLPIFNLVLPYLAVKAVWNASARAGSDAQDPPSAVIGQWWAAWLSTLTVLVLVGELVSRRFVNRNWPALLVNLLGMLASLATLRLVRVLHARQSARAAELWPILR
jgi:hypothetical protein